MITNTATKTGSTMVRAKDVGMAASGVVLRALPAQTFEIRMTKVSAGTAQEVGRYVMNHSPYRAAE